MKTYTLKSVARRGSMLGAAFVVAVAAFLPAVSASADALNPLTERSLTLSSSSPGWSYLDASGNPTFAPPNSGANGNQTGNTFSFRVSTGEEVKGISFQYCTTSAGNCMGPGNIATAGTPGCLTRGANDMDAYALKQSDLEVKTSSPSEVTTYATKFDALLGQPATTSTYPSGQWNSNTAHANVPKADNSEGNFIVLHKSKSTPNGPWVQSTGWTMAADVNQTKNGAPGTVAAGTSTGKNNYITLARTTANAGTELNVAAGDYVKIIFFGTNTNYITNPGDKEFFVKINTFRTDDTAAFDTSAGSSTIIDGGVTVANVMNRSIEIQTKVLETMNFSVGTVDPNTLDSTGGATSQFHAATGNNEHNICDPIEQGMIKGPEAKNILKMGDPDGEFSLRTDTTYSTHSYWRLSSNSSAGATVYYSGVTLSNTVGDQINAIGPTAAAPSIGSEQFGLALDNETSGNRLVSYTKEDTTRNGSQFGYFQNGEDNGLAGIHATTTAAVNGNASWHTPQLAPLAPLTGYAEGKGNVNASYGTINTKFAFDPESSAIPTPFASGNEVLDCVTGKMRYIANIAATTPAGIYTTKINYIAAPKY